MSTPLPTRPQRSPRAVRSRGRGVSVAAVALALTLPACATKSDIRDLQDEIRQLAVRQDSALARLAEVSEANRDTLQVQSRQLFEMRGQVAQEFLQIQDQLVTIQELTGQSQRNLQALRDQIESRQRALSEAGPDEVSASAGGAENLYNTALSHLQRGSLTTARSAFTQFLETYPNHTLAADAHFYLADILEQESRLEEAIERFGRIAERFPTSPRVPDALYRVGRLHMQLGRTREARSFLERVVNTYPDSGAAVLAREALSEIR